MLLKNLLTALAFDGLRVTHVFFRKLVGHRPYIELRLLVPLGSGFNTHIISNGREDFNAERATGAVDEMFAPDPIERAGKPKNFFVMQTPIRHRVGQTFFWLLASTSI